VMPVAYHDPRRHAFKVESVAETVRALEVIERIRARHLPRLRVLYTVSPLRFLATFRPVSAVTANSVSKAIVRAALDEFLRSRWELVNATYFYFPSYEIVTDVLVDPFTEDQNHLHEYVLALVLDLFARHYTTFEAAGVSSGIAAPAGGLEDRLARVEQAYTERVQQLARLNHRCAQLEAEVAAFRQAAGVAPALRTAAGLLARLVPRPRRRR
jgi:GSCFA family protein